MKGLKNITLRDIRKKNGLSVKDAAQKLEISEQYIYKMEIGKREPGKKLINKMSGVYGCTIEQIFFAIKRTDSATMSA